MVYRRICAGLLAAVLALTALGGCSAEGLEGQPQELENGTEDATELAEEEEEETLIIATGAFSGDFRGIFTTTDNDQLVVDMTTVPLLGKTRSGAYVLNGIEGETEYYNGATYSYDGIADCVVTDLEDGSVTYDFTLRDDVTFSDGEPLTADDLIFTLYLYLDPSYEGDVALNTLPIAGLDAYTQYSEPLYQLLLDKGSKNTNFDYFSEKTQAEFYDDYWPAAKTAFMGSIMDYYETDSVTDVMVALDIAEIRDTGMLVTYHTYARWDIYNDDEPTQDDLWSELMNIDAYSKEVSLMSEDLVERGIAAQSIFSYLPDSYRKYIDSSADAAKQIAGIEKTGDHSVRITLTQADSEALDKLAVPILPLQYYGDTDSYNYEKNKFGFTKGNLLALEEEITDPLGAGPYVYLGYADGVISFEANASYWRGEPQTKYIQFMEMSESQMAEAVANGYADIAEPSISKSDVEQICAVNSNGDTSGDVITTTFTDYDAIGYIGINAQTVCVGNNPASGTSIALRKAIATVLAFYRAESVSDYYGSTAQLIDYPISATAWVTPHEWESSYAYAYRQDSDGNLIYSVHDSYSERKKKVLAAALDDLEIAGYTVVDGVVTEAPAGAKMQYEVMISGGGVGDHPSYQIVTNAASALGSIGLTLKVTDLESSDEMFAACQAGTAEIWCAAWTQNDSVDAYLNALFHSNGSSQYMFSLATASLDTLLDSAHATSDPETQKTLYRKCLDTVMADAVMVPVYQRQNCTLYSTKNMDTDSITADQTVHYGWMQEIYLLRKN